MSPRVETFTPPHTPTPIGPYNHVAKVGQFITIGGTAGVNSATGELAGPDVYSQTKQILDAFKVMLESVGSDLNHVIHVNVFLKDMGDFDRMNQAYSEQMGNPRPARTVIAVAELPKPAALLTMNLTAVTRGPSLFRQGAPDDTGSFISQKQPQAMNQVGSGEASRQRDAAPASSSATALLELCMGLRASQALFVAAQLGIADHLGGAPSQAPIWPRGRSRTLNRCAVCCVRSRRSVSSPSRQMTLSY